MNRTVMGAMMGAALAAAPAVSAAQAPVAVAGSSFQIDVFGGGDEGGTLYGAAPSVTLPIGDSLGLQVDGIAGMVADELGVYGGAVQLFFRQPEHHLLGIAASGLVVDGETQVSVAAIGEYYLERMTLEALAGYQSGDIGDGFVGRLGLSFYGGDGFRMGIGASYGDIGKFGADAELEYMAFPENGLALFASGGFDDGGALGLVGLRLYAGGEDAPSLLVRHRTLGRRNLYLAAPTVTGTRFISRAGGAMAGGSGFGDIAPVAVPVEEPSVLAGSAVGDLLGDLVATGTGQAPLGGLLGGILPGGTTGTPIDSVPIVGDLVGSLAALVSGETLRVGDLPTGPGSLASLPLVGDILGLLPAEGVTALVGSLKPGPVLTRLVPDLLSGLLGNLAGGLAGANPVP
ncbi:hypothetical protein L2U69_16700 [Zavarzinia compransoris]|uniref:hypothetical protein n=1 Tax=Zavarzinia marina TaxID=2911065 RepID=UPI001F1D74E3|nr:hypothetical protein [Zavarzinia marina]MCF4167290.1 hypothetical protein [Zavarzinia marina]